MGVLPYRSSRSVLTQWVMAEWLTLTVSAALRGGVPMVENPLCRSELRFCREMFTHQATCRVGKVSISSPIRWPVSVCHYTCAEVSELARAAGGADRNAVDAIGLAVGAGRWGSWR